MQNCLLPIADDEDNNGDDDDEGDELEDDDDDALGESIHCHDSWSQYPWPANLRGYSAGSGLGPLSQIFSQENGRRTN